MTGKQQGGIFSCFGDEGKHKERSCQEEAEDKMGLGTDFDQFRVGGPFSRIMGRKVGTEK